VSTTDQLLLARISGICSRHCARGEIDDPDGAVADLRAVAGDRLDLLATHAGISIGTAQDGLPLLASRYRAEADLCIAAGADLEQLGPWIEVGRQRTEQARLTPYTGSSSSGLAARRKPTIGAAIDT
jgi:hypothetical protein